MRTKRSRLSALRVIPTRLPLPVSSFAFETRVSFVTGIAWPLPNYKLSDKRTRDIEVETAFLLLAERYNRADRDRMIYVEIAGVPTFRRYTRLTLRDTSRDPSDASRYSEISFSVSLPRKNGQINLIHEN